MKKCIIYLIVLLPITVYGQKEVVMEKLAAYGITDDFLNTSLQDHDATYAFDIKTTTDDGKKTNVNKGNFNPKLPVGERWTLVSTNGESPSKKKIKKFNKAHNTTETNINGKVDDNSWKIISDTDDEVVISFKYLKDTLPVKFAFLSKCTGSAYINKKTKHLGKATFANDGTIVIKVFTVSKLDMTINYLYVEEAQAYYMEKEHLNMEVNLLGEKVNIDELNEYSNYKKVK